MNKGILLLVVLISSNSFLFGEEETPSYKTVSTFIEGAIAAIEAKDANKFFSECVSPKDVSKIKEKGDFEEIKKKFMEGEKAGALLLVLKKLKDITPVYSKENDSLTFSDDKLRALVLSREDGKWYIKN